MLSTAAVPVISTTAVPAVSTPALPSGLPGLAPERATQTGPTGPWYIGEIVIQGNEFVKTKVIRKEIRAKEKDLYTRSDVNKDIENIMGLGSFEKATAEAVSLPGKAVPDQFLKTVGSTTAVR